MRIVLLITAASLAAPASATDGDSQFWAAASATASLGDGFQGGVETTLRFGDDADGLYEGEYGVYLGYELAKGTVAQIGYVRIPAYSRTGVTNRENRLRQQIGFDIAEIAGGKLTGRVRLEQRWRDTGEDMGLRVRPFVKWSLPISKGGAAFVLSHESFVNINDTDWGQNGGYDRMRHFVGFNVPVVKGLKAELGYLNQYGFGRGASQDSVDDVASISFAYSF